MTERGAHTEKRTLREKEEKWSNNIQNLDFLKGIGYVFKIKTLIKNVKITQALVHQKCLISIQQSITTLKEIPQVC